MHYNYDGGGQRTRKTITKNGLKQKERLYLGLVERYQEYDSNGVVTLERWTLQVEGLAQVDTLTVRHAVGLSSPTPVARYQYRDRLGSSTIEANELGQVISYEEYYPYGASAYRAAASGVDLSLKRYRFTGKERDEETGLDYFGVRYYAPWLGRWTSGDPGGFVDGLNLYRYTRNNPVNGIDRDGYSTEVIEDTPPPAKKKEPVEEDLPTDNTFTTDQELIIDSPNPTKIHLLLYSNNNNHSYDTETFNAAALKMKKEYSDQYPNDKPKLSGVENGKVIASAINKQKENSIATFDYYGHGYHEGLTFPHMKEWNEFPDPNRGIDDFVITRKSNLYKDRQTAINDMANGGQYSTLEDIYMKNFTQDCRVEIHGCNTAGGIEYNRRFEANPPSVNTENNFVATFSKLLYDAGKTNAVVIGHFGAAGPDESNDYRQNTRVIFHNGVELYSTKKKGEITKEEINFQLLKKSIVEWYDKF